MTEAEGYKLLGWAKEGGSPSPFVLPMTNDGGDWVATRCDSCNISGLSRREFFILRGGCCDICGQPYTETIG